MKLVKTGVKATAEQAIEIERMCDQAENTPVISFGGGPDAASVSWSMAKKFIDKCARANGLPNMKKYQYSYHRGEKQFYKPEDKNKVSRRRIAKK